MNKIYLVKSFLAISLILGTTACNLAEEVTIEPVPTITADSSSGFDSTADNTAKDNKHLLDAKVTRVVDGLSP